MKPQMNCPICNAALPTGPCTCPGCGRVYKYRRKGAKTHFSERYNRSITVPDQYPSDGATDAFDIKSESWWFHDVVCDRGTWDDGTPVTNWQASVVLSDILHSEGRWWRSWRWLMATFFFGGGKARANGMFRLKNTNKVAA
ncbi:MAG: hypothetical protein WBB19_10885 [Desulforhopalus sp.]